MPRRDYDDHQHNLNDLHHFDNYDDYHLDHKYDDHDMLAGSLVLRRHDRRRVQPR